ncbi:ABC-2 type transport system ATP-binding protein [Eilatimonas milleporae]|uniref:ABC-2 type transport system ATP-binding protein n=1 Tax=Eilatimonas milleporae TaxID=911205 RepID=A0A3M0CF97_9PROT|nr:ATP-binding cassette domain-containing protein [Eilatimonas milleporae]RMB07655.1 ABC-2 type transport system ATP-binding protein [Eilatimonas milleporae]
MHALLKAEDLSKNFNGLTALSGLNLSIAEGEIFCLLGANGAGKTTTINLFLGFLTPSGGTAFVDGCNVADAPEDARKRLAYIPENVALYPTLSGIENLEFFDSLAGERTPREALLDILAEAGLDRDAAERKAGAYSKGMRQKVGIAIALAKKARVLLLDEPLSGLDPAAANGFCALLKKLQADGCAVLMATHDVFRAKEVGSRIGIMKSGQLVDILDADTLDAGEIERVYLAHMHGETGQAA